jgi:peptide/nickel transport system permease protein
MSSLSSMRDAPAAEDVRVGRRLRIPGVGVASALGRALALFVPVFVVGTFVTYLLGYVSGLSPAHLLLGESATPEAVARIEHEWGMDRPFVVRYATWFASLMRGDLGSSWYNGQPISRLLAERAVISLSVAGLGLAVGVVAGFTLGALAGVFHTSWVDRAITAITTLMSVVPSFVAGIVLVAVFAVTLRWLPSAGYVPIDEGIRPWLGHVILPALALSFDTTADVARQLRSGLVSAYRENYVTGALLRGFGRRRIFLVHVLPNAIAPTLAMLGLKFPNLLGGAVVTETIFGLAGYGKFASESALRGDVPAVQGVLVVSVVLVVAFNVLVNTILNGLVPGSGRGT